MLTVLLRSLLAIVALLTAFAYTMLLERKVLGFFQLRYGPTKVGPWGLMQPLADAVKMMLKEDIRPAGIDRFIFWLAPSISLFAAFAVFAVVPIGPGGAVADPPGGLLYFLALASLGVYGVSLGGWSSQSKYSLLGSLRATAQMISYELAMGMALLAVVALAGTLSLQGMVAAQARIWFFLPEIVAFVIYLICATAEGNRAPFDLAEAESELVAGYHTEYSGLRFAMFVMAEYINAITLSVLGALLFLGGWRGPAPIPGIIWLLLKTGALIFVLMWVRATFPRLRYDKLMDFGWKWLLPLAFLNLAGTAIFIAVRG
ncbi:MAG TPA: NADH-quinone oxidoreductase subunit NuoH [Bacillota bacterium]|nr:NADH-quinone oxidoreductase subunit NuoH [Bacillota bacterium]